MKKEDKKRCLWDLWGFGVAWGSRNSEVDGLMENKKSLKWKKHLSFSFSSNRCVSDLRSSPLLFSSYSFYQLSFFFLFNCV
ncbi:hypothetical protein RIF29_26350 [Crotalaria pallida]|uniref:Uncharacterized protein n=1 Tax=Crotalaria pallida TaxID=3830 RepID=A0AAN9I1M8_CROPI